MTLTETAQSLQAARESAKTVPFDEARIAEIKSAIDEGRYRIDNERLASKLMNLESLTA